MKKNFSIVRPGAGIGLQKVPLFTLLFFFAMQVLSAQTWTGAVNTDWNTPGNWSGGAVPLATGSVTIPDVANDPVLSGAAATKKVTMQVGSSLIVAAGGSLAISGAAGRGFDIFGTVENNGTISINDNSQFYGLDLRVGGSFTNKGTLQIGNTGNIPSTGIRNEGTFVNESGTITVDRTGNLTGAIINYASFTNKASITIGGIAQILGFGLWLEQGIFVNEEGGNITIDRVARSGLLIQNTQGFTNKGSISIGAILGSIGEDGIRSFRLLLNDSCGKISLFDNVINASTAVITNAGLFTINTAATHTNNGTFTNNGILEYPQGNPVPNVTNNDLIVAPITSNCPFFPNALQKGGALSFTVGSTWYQDQALSIPAGTYNQASNTFTPTNLPLGVSTLYCSIADDVHPCPRTVSIKVTQGTGTDATPPNITCPANISINNNPICSSVVNYATPTATDNCSVPSVVLQSGLPSGAVYPVGTTTNVWKATDAANLTSTCSFEVTVTLSNNNNTPPAITCPTSAPVLTANGNCQALLGDYAGLANFTGSCVQQIPAPGTAVNPGTVAVHLTAYNDAGQEADCVFNVSITGSCGGGN